MSDKNKNQSQPKPNVNQPKPNVKREVFREHVNPNGNGSSKSMSFNNPPKPPKR